MVLELHNLHHQIKDDEDCGVPENHEYASDKDEQMKELSGELKSGISTTAQDRSRLEEHQQPHKLDWIQRGQQWKKQYVLQKLYFSKEY